MLLELAIYKLDNINDCPFMITAVLLYKRAKRSIDINLKSIKHTIHQLSHLPCRRSVQQIVLVPY